MANEKPTNQNLPESQRMRREHENDVPGRPAPEPAKPAPEPAKPAPTETGQGEGGTGGGAA